MKKKTKKADVVKADTPKKLPWRPIEWTEERINAETDALEKWIENPRSLYIASFLEDRKLHPEQLERFSRYSERFRETLARAKNVQERRIIEGSLNKTFDGNFAKFLLSTRFGYRERTEITSADGNPLAIILDKIGSKRDVIEVEPERLEDQS